MAPRKNVASLKDLCFPIAYSLIQNIIENHHDNESASEAQLIDDLKMVVDQVPLMLHDKIVDVHLCNIKKMFGEKRYKYTNRDYDDCECDGEGNLESNSDGKCICMDEDTVYLDISLKVISLLKIKKIKLSEGTMPLYLLNKLIGLIDKISNLESFTIYDFWTVKFRVLRSKLLKTVPSWSNLTTFICPEFCTDEILSSVCKNCKFLQEVDLKHCLDLEDPIGPLLGCKNLRAVNLDSMSVDTKEYLRLLLETKSNNFNEIRGRDYCVLEIIKQLEKMKSPRTFQLQYFYARCLPKRQFDQKHLKLITKYFPSLTKICFQYWYFDSRPKNNPHILSTLKELEHLKEMTLSFLRCPSVISLKFLSSCPHVKTVSFSPVHEIDLISFLSEVSKSCVSVEKLIIDSLPRDNEAPMHTFNEGLTLAMEPFQNLTHLMWSDAPLPYLMHILGNANTIKIIEILNDHRNTKNITTTDNGVLLTDGFFRFILKSNPLSQLEQLYIDCPNTLSPEMITMLIVNCEYLTSFSVRENSLSWSAIPKFISENNYCVDFEVITGVQYYCWKFRI